MSFLRIPRVFKDVAEFSLGAVAWRTRSVADRTGCVILAYHNVRPGGADPVGERSLHISWDRFLRHLDLIQELANVVGLADAFTPGESRSRLRVVLTFDDAYAGAVELALPEIARRGLPATLFVAPALLDGRSFWWDQLADSTGGVLAHEARSHALACEGGDQGRVQAWARAQGLPWRSTMPAWATGATLDAVRQSANLPGISVGAHSWAHPNLTAVDDGRLRDELQHPRHWIQAHGLGASEWLAYPYGLASAATAVATEAAGYSGAVLVAGGFIRERHSRFLLPRINIPAGLTPAGLRLRLSGWLSR